MGSWPKGNSDRGLGSARYPGPDHGFAYVYRYNDVRLHSATGYITPKDMQAGRQQRPEVGGARKHRQIHCRQAA